MIRARIITLVTLPVLLLGTGCREGSDSSPPDERDGSVEQRFDDVESTLDIIESELADD